MRCGVAIHSAEAGDGTLECRDIPHTLQMMDLFSSMMIFYYMICVKTSWTIKGLDYMMEPTK